jgi:hypothetical protein
MMKAMTKKLIALVVFGMAFGFVEAAVVYYLRTIVWQHCFTGPTACKLLHNRDLHLPFFTFAP